MNIALYTDDISVANILPYFFKEIPCTVYSRFQLDASHDINCTHIILSVYTLDIGDLQRLKTAIGLGKETYLMIRDPLTAEEARLARDIGVKDILIDPISLLLRNVINTPEKLFSLLMYPDLHEVLEDIPELINIGSDTYFHPSQYWVKYGDTRTELSEKEAALLLFFLQHEGRIITKHALAKELWGGFIQADGISKVIARMKNKLGPARDLISARHLGGFLYLRNETGNTKPRSGGDE
jgi:two-component system OmpR family response regulator